MKTLALAFLFVASAAVAADQTPFGIAGDPAKVSRTIAIDMSDDMRYAPATVDVKLGETVRFVVANKGATMHELVLGTPKDIAQHAQSMSKAPVGMAHHDHQMPSMVHVHPRRQRRDRVAVQPRRHVSPMRASFPAITRPG
jgi:uncharacterized cupredoxin-like copper-binding protein